MPLTLQFLGWWRPSSAQAAGSGALSNGRRRGHLVLTAQDIDDGTQSATRTLGFDLVGPGDVTGLAPAAVVRTYPSRGAVNVEHDKAVYADLAAPDLPWRYTVALPQGRALRPWLVLLVGTVDEIEVQGTVAVVAPSVLADHPFTRSQVGAHVERDQPTAQPLARLVSSRALLPSKEHRAVIVPAFDADGAPAWPTPATVPVELPAFDAWTFHTRAGGDFAVIARRLKLHPAGDDLGNATVRHAPLPDADPMVAAGALVSATRPTGDPGPPTAEVVADVTELTAPLGDAAHPVLSLPAYDSSWPAEDPTAAPAGWRAELRGDPRARGLAGLGAQAGVSHQDLLADAAGRVAGAYEEAAERLRRLSLGLLATRSLWRRRIPTDGVRQLTVLGPALRRVLSGAGPVAEALARGDRALGPALFSTAAKRSWRTTGSTALGAADPDGHDTALRRAAAPPAPPLRDATSVAHTDELGLALGRPPLDDTVGRRPPSVRTLLPELRQLSDRFDRGSFGNDAVRDLDQRLRKVADRLDSARDTAVLPLLSLLDAPTNERPTERQLRRLAAALDDAPDSDDLARLGARLTRRPVPVSTETVDLDAASAAIAAAFDPTLDRPAMVDRVLDGIGDLRDVGGAADQPLSPPELLPELGMPAWRFLRDQAPQWLLHGAGELPADSVVALGTNPAFVDAFLVGLNAQVLAELRFRNLPMLPGWTPVRTFWERADGAGPVDDILDIAAWPDDSAFGSADHQTPSAASSDLVVLFNTPLFREYPGTVVYLAPAALRPNGTSDWSAPAVLSAALFPSFQGQLAAERVFFGFDLDPSLVTSRWVVLEETMQGRRFWNAGDPSHRDAIRDAVDGAQLAEVSITRPRRVLIRGDVLLGALT